MVAEAEETERLRAELDRTREDAERLLAAERAEVARLREEMLNSEVDEERRRGLAADARARHARPRARARDVPQAAPRARRAALGLGRAAARGLVRDRQRHARDGRAAGAATAAGRAVRTPEGTQRRVEAARVAASTRVPRVPPSPVSLWAVRVLAALLVAALGVALVVLSSRGVT